jgi:hypothetical protein
MRLALKSAPNAPILDIGTSWGVDKITDQVLANLRSFGYASERGKAIIAWAKDYPVYVDEDILHARAVPGFAIGTNYVPRDMLAQIHEGEAIVPKAYNPAIGGQRNNNARLEALVEALIKTNERLETRLAAIEGSNQRSADALNGRSEMPMLVETV